MGPSGPQSSTETRYEVEDGGSGSARCTGNGRWHGALWGTADKDTGQRAKVKGQRTDATHTRVHGSERRLRRRQRVLATKVAWGKKQRPRREVPLLIPIIAPPGDSFPPAFPMPELRAVSRGFPLHPSSMWLTAVFPIPACSHIWRGTIRRFSTHTHALLIPRRIWQCTTRVPPLCRPAAPIHAPAVAERGR